MTAKVVVSLVAASLALLGCSQQSTSQMLNCTPQNCKVAVTITGDCSDATMITVQPPTLPVPKEHHNLKIAWDIQNNTGFKFVPAPNGITFTTPPLPPANEFTNAHDNGKKYDLTDTNSPTPNGQPIDYKYNIHLQRDNGTACAVKDPFIKNGA